MAFENYLPEQINIGSGEILSTSGFTATETEFDNTVVVGRFAQRNAGVLTIPANTTAPLSGVVARNITKALELGSGVDLTREPFVNIHKRGAITVDAVAGITVGKDEKVYVVATGADAGKVTNVATGNIATSATFLRSEGNDVYRILL